MIAAGIFFLVSMVAVATGLLSNRLSEIAMAISRLAAAQERAASAVERQSYRDTPQKKAP